MTEIIIIEEPLPNRHGNIAFNNETELTTIAGEKNPEWIEQLFDEEAIATIPKTEEEVKQEEEDYEEDDDIQGEMMDLAVNFAVSGQDQADSQDKSKPSSASSNLSTSEVRILKTPSQPQYRYPKLNSVQFTYVKQTYANAKRGSIFSFHPSNDEFETSRRIHENVQANALANAKNKKLVRRTKILRINQPEISYPLLGFTQETTSDQEGVTKIIKKNTFSINDIEDWDKILVFLEQRKLNHHGETNMDDLSFEMEHPNLPFPMDNSPFVAASLDKVEDTANFLRSNYSFDCQETKVVYPTKKKPTQPQNSTLLSRLTGTSANGVIPQSPVSTTPSPIPPLHALAGIGGKDPSSPSNANGNNNFGGKEKKINTNVNKKVKKEESPTKPKSREKRKKQEAASANQNDAQISENEENENKTDENNNLENDGQASNNKKQKAGTGGSEILTQRRKSRTLRSARKKEKNPVSEKENQPTNESKESEDSQGENPVSEEDNQQIEESTDINNNLEITNSIKAKKKPGTASSTSKKKKKSKKLPKPHAANQVDKSLPPQVESIGLGTFLPHPPLPEEKIEFIPPNPNPDLPSSSQENSRNKSGKGAFRQTSTSEGTSGRRSNSFSAISFEKKQQFEQQIENSKNFQEIEITKLVPKESVLKEIEKMIIASDFKIKANAIAEFLQYFDVPSEQTEIAKSETVLTFFKKNLAPEIGDHATSFLATRCIFKLCSSRKSKEILIQDGILDVLMDYFVFLTSNYKIEFLLNPSSAQSGSGNSTQSMKAQSKKSRVAKLIREVIKCLNHFSKMMQTSSAKTKKVLLTRFGTRTMLPMLQSLQPLLQQNEEFKTQKYALKCLCYLLKGVEKSPSEKIVHSMMIEIGIIEKSLYPLMKTTNYILQKITLKTFFFLSNIEGTREALYKKGIFHSFLWLIRDKTVEIRKLALLSLVQFVPNENIHIDALLLKYGLELFIRFFVEANPSHNEIEEIASSSKSKTSKKDSDDNSQTDSQIANACAQLLAHLSEYHRIHKSLMEKLVLKQMSKHISSNLITSASFGSLIILSNVTKHKEWQQVVYNSGLLTVLFKFLNRLIFVSENEPALIRLTSNEKDKTDETSSEIKEKESKDETILETDDKNSTNSSPTHSRKQKLNLEKEIGITVEQKTENSMTESELSDNSAEIETKSKEKDSKKSKKPKKSKKDGPSEQEETEKGNESEEENFFQDIPFLKNKTTFTLNKNVDTTFKPEEIEILPKVLTRTIANLSVCPCCQREIASRENLDSLCKLSYDSKDRTVIWNGICALSNICEDKTLHKSIIERTFAKKCILKYLSQKSDSKLRTRAMRCVASLSKSDSILDSLSKFGFDVEMMLKISISGPNAPANPQTTNPNNIAGAQSPGEEFQLGILKVLAAYAQHADYHPKLLKFGAIEHLLKLSYSNFPSNHLEIVRIFFFMAQNPLCKPILLKEGVVPRLWQLKESTNQDIRNYCISALQKL